MPAPSTTLSNKSNLISHRSNTLEVFDEQKEEGLGLGESLVLTEVRFLEVSSLLGVSERTLMDINNYKSNHFISKYDSTHFPLPDTLLTSRSLQTRIFKVKVSDASELLGT